MAEVTKRRRLANPRQRRMSPSQVAIFGTKRQKAALRRRHPGLFRKYAKKAAGHSRRRGRRNQSFDYSGIGTSTGGLITKAEQAAERAIQSVEHAAHEALDGVTRRLNRPKRRNAGRRSLRKTKKHLKKTWGARAGRAQHRLVRSGAAYKRRRTRNVRRANVGEILTVIPANPGRRRNRRMARAANRRRNRRRNWRDPRTGLANRRRRRVSNRRHRNRGRARVYNRRRSRMHNRRRNPGFMSGTTGTIVGILGGATVTKLITGMLPSTLMSGWAGMATTGVTAVVAGQVAGKVFRNPHFGKWMTIGGLLIVALEALNQFLPSLQLPFGLSTGTSGMGLISSSNYYVPQVNLPGSMASFVTPAGVTGALPMVPATGMSGFGGPQFNPGLRTMRRIGRMR